MFLTLAWLRSFNPFRRTHHDNNNNNSYFVLFLDSERSWHRRRRCCGADPYPESAREPEKRESRRPEVESSDPAADAADDRRPVRRRRRQNTGHLQRLTRWQSFLGHLLSWPEKISGASFTQSHPKLRFYLLGWHLWSWEVIISVLLSYSSLAQTPGSVVISCSKKVEKSSLATQILFRHD